MEHLRLTAIELQMAPIRTAVHIQVPVYLAVLKEGKKLGDFDFLNQSRQGHAGPAGLVDQCAEGGARAGRAIAPDRVESPRGINGPRLSDFDGRTNG